MLDIVSACTVVECSVGGERVAVSAPEASLRAVDAVAIDIDDPRTLAGLVAAARLQQSSPSSLSSPRLHERHSAIAWTSAGLMIDDQSQSAKARAIGSRQAPGGALDLEAEMGAHHADTANPLSATGGSAVVNVGSEVLAL